MPSEELVEWDRQAYGVSTNAGRDRLEQLLNYACTQLDNGSRWALHDVLLGFSNTGCERIQVAGIGRIQILRTKWPVLELTRFRILLCNLDATPPVFILAHDIKESDVKHHTDKLRDCLAHPRPIRKVASGPRRDFTSRDIGAEIIRILEKHEQTPGMPLFVAQISDELEMESNTIYDRLERLAGRNQIVCARVPDWGKRSYIMLRTEEIQSPEHVIDIIRGLPARTKGKAIVHENLRKVYEFVRRRTDESPTRRLVDANDVCDKKEGVMTSYARAKYCLDHLVRRGILREAGTSSKPSKGRKAMSFELNE